jgi:phenylpyruvate tautomerase PptA (4-oxalocrotonate tautomerase family)
MPNILVKTPKGAYPGEHRVALVRGLQAAAATAEQMPDDPRHQFLCWVLLDEVPSGHWFCGGTDLTAQVLPCVANVLLPAGVLDAAARAAYVQLMHDAFKAALPASEKRRLVTSVLLHEVPDGHWGANGVAWSLPDFAQAAGYAHLQHLVPAKP